jgi:hypothetical protein
MPEDWHVRPPIGTNPAAWQARRYLLRHVTEHGCM